MNNKLLSIISILSLLILQDLLLQRTAVAQKSKYSSNWVSDSKHQEIQFKFTRQKDPSGSKDSELYKYAYKNNSSKTWRISFEITGAGLESPHIGSKIIGPNQTKKDAWTMFLDADPGGMLKSRITKVEDVGKRLKSIKDDFDELNNELSPKKNQEISNDQISKILKDNQTSIKAFAKSAINKNSSSSKGKNNFSTSKPQRARTETTASKMKQQKQKPKTFAAPFSERVKQSKFGKLVVMAKLDPIKFDHSAHALYGPHLGTWGKGKPSITAEDGEWMRIIIPLESKIEDGREIAQDYKPISLNHNERSNQPFLRYKAPNGVRTYRIDARLYGPDGSSQAMGQRVWKQQGEGGDGGFRGSRSWQLNFRLIKQGSKLQFRDFN